ncbi:MAG: helicase C-terminal domain-containing protein [Archaeoglobaceae archaeon]
MKILERIFSVIDSFVKEKREINDNLLSELLQKTDIRLFPDQAKTLKFLYQSTKKFKIIEAPTGTGKTISYILYALTKEKFDKIVISVSTKLLQSQVVQDLKRFTDDFVILMGRSNYICADKAEFYNIDLSFIPKNIKEKIQVSRYYCRPEYQEKCKFFLEGKCEYVNTIEAAKTKKVIIINHALLPYIINVLTLNSPTLLIVDECHLLPFERKEKLFVSEEDLVEPKEPDPKDFNSIRDYNFALEEYFKHREKYEILKKQNIESTGVFPVDRKIDYSLDFYSEVIFVSATVPDLPVSPEETDALYIEDRRNWSAVTISIKDVNYRDKKYEKELISLIKEASKRYNKVLVLCTSYQQLELIKANVPECVTSKEMGTFRIVQKMRDGEIKIAAGTDVFWTGIDIPGKKCIIMTKLPFPVPDDDNDDTKGFISGFESMFKKFKQGIGRMLRSSECGGEIIILDNRLVNYKELIFYLSELEKAGAKVVYECKKEEINKNERAKLTIVK